MSTCRSVQERLNKRFFFFFSHAYRAELATFGTLRGDESAADGRLVERIASTSELLVVVEDLILHLGPSPVSRSASGRKFDILKPLGFLRLKLASLCKDLLIAKRSGWPVLSHMKNAMLSGERKFHAKARAVVAAAKKTPARRSSSGPPAKRRSTSAASSTPKPKQPVFYSFLFYLKKIVSKI